MHICLQRIIISFLFHPEKYYSTGTIDSWILLINFINTPSVFLFIKSKNEKWSYIESMDLTLYPPTRIKFYITRFRLFFYEIDINTERLLFYLFSNKLLSCTKGKVLVFIIFWPVHHAYLISCMTTNYFIFWKKNKQMSRGDK